MLWQLTPHVELWREGMRHYQCYTGADIRIIEKSRASIMVEASLANLQQERLPHDSHSLPDDVPHRIGSRGYFWIDAHRMGRRGAGASGDRAGCPNTTAPQKEPLEDIFYMVGGFATREFMIHPDGDAR